MIHMISELVIRLLIVCFSISSVLFLIIYPISRFALRIALHPWVMALIVNMIHWLLTPLKDLRSSLEKLEGRDGSHTLEAERTPLLLPPPTPPRADLNKASVNDLKSIPGVGFVRALEIIEYRERFGDYRRVEELGMIPGIGAKTIERIGELFEVR